MDRPDTKQPANDSVCILVVEDHPDQRDLQAAVLRREGYRVITASNGIEALKALRAEQIHIVLSDVMMPKLDGFEIIKNIRGDADLKNIYIIMITARTQEVDRVHGLDLGADDYITKPFSFSELLARIRGGARIVQYQQQLEHQTQIDSLTGLYNRRAFEKRLTEEIERATRHGHPLSLLMLDVDNFKIINDTHGHQAGDAALVRICEILRTEMRQSDFLSRFGGEEFVLILPENDHESAMRAAQRILTEVRSSAFTTHDAQFSMTLSIGVSSTAIYPYGNASKMVEDADRALYSAKHNGKNRVEVFWPKADTSDPCPASSSPHNVDPVSKATEIRSM
jgi:two-component system, cell cycle response regulator